MREQAVSRGRSSPVGSLRSMQRGLPILEPLSAVSKILAHISSDLRAAARNIGF